METSDLILAHKQSSRHRSAMIIDQRCGCFYCCKTFYPGEITAWTDDDDTALCPYCDIDSVLPRGGSLGSDFLKQMYQYWFGEMK